jgi:hypothetical protein
LAGYGFVRIAKDGKMEPRTLVDRNRCGHSTLATRPARDEITRAWQARSGV